MCLRCTPVHTKVDAPSLSRAGLAGTNTLISDSRPQAWARVAVCRLSRHMQPPGISCAYRAAHDVHKPSRPSHTERQPPAVMSTPTFRPLISHWNRHRSVQHALGGLPGGWMEPLPVFTGVWVSCWSGPATGIPTPAPPRPTWSCLLQAAPAHNAPSRRGTQISDLTNE